MKSKIIYYENELTDDFSGFQRNRIDIDQSYPYMRGKLWSLGALVLWAASSQAPASTRW